MKMILTLAVVTVLCGVITLGTAVPYGAGRPGRYPPWVPYATDLANAQWHLSAPARGCVEYSHSLGGSVFRVYICDAVNGPCIFNNFVQVCGASSLFFKPASQRLVNVRSREHLVRFYNDIGTSCYLSILPQCFPSNEQAETAAAGDDQCRCESLPTGEKICDPWKCDKEEGKVIAEDNDDTECRCETLPTGEKVCDPWKCDKHGQKDQMQGLKKQAFMETLLHLLERQN